MNVSIRCLVAWIFFNPVDSAIISGSRSRDALLAHRLQVHAVVDHLAHGTPPAVEDAKHIHHNLNNNNHGLQH